MKSLPLLSLLTPLLLGCGEDAAEITQSGMSETGLCGATQGQLFDASYPWNQRVDEADTDAESDAIINYLQTQHTATARFRIDGPSDSPNSIYGITVLTADTATRHENFDPSSGLYSPDCDRVAMPIPEGAIEGDGDCHRIVVDTDECRLFEMFRANRTEASFAGGCLALWDLTAPYTETLRGDCCTSADAADLPIAAHMFNADEIAGGEICRNRRLLLDSASQRATRRLDSAVGETRRTRA